MDTTIIYNFLTELLRCDYRALEEPMDISRAKYNGVTYNEGPETYRRNMTSAFADFKAAVLDLSLQENAQKPLAAILADFKAGSEQYWDIPDDETLTALQNDYIKENVPSMLTTIREIIFLQQMNAIQKDLLREAIGFLEKLVIVEDADKQEAQAASPANKEGKAAQPEIISGVQGLADYFGCSKGTAFMIIKSGVLKAAKVQFKIGENWKFKRERLDEYLAENPEVLGRNKRK